MNKKWQYIENDIELAKKIADKYGVRVTHSWSDCK